MRQTLLILFLTCLFHEFSISQNQAIELTFSSQFEGGYIVPDSVLIENITQGGDTTLYPPDTVLYLDFITGIDPGQSAFNEFSVMQNKPNPFTDETNIMIFIPVSGDLKINIVNLLGQNIATFNGTVNPGMHSFVFHPGNEKYYILSAIYNGTTKTIKMLSMNQGSSNSSTLFYSGRKGKGADFKAAAKSGDFMFSIGDQLRFSCYTKLSQNIMGCDTIEDIPMDNEDYLFSIMPYDPCFGETTITDINGNVYNTVVIGFQCWMKENLKATSYRNGTPIQNVTSNNNWSNLTTGAYAWNDNDITWKDPYGALYNWYAVDDTSRLCPAGWHVPTNIEFNELTGFIGGTGSPFGNILKSCRQVNSPLGGECNTVIHPRWEQDFAVYGSDDYDFSGLPGGYRSLVGNFGTIGYSGAWWTSSKESTGFAWSYNLYYSYDYITVSSLNMKSGFSVRCLRSDTISGLSSMFPSNPSPGDGSIDISVDTVLSWSSADPNGGDLTFNIYFDTLAASTLIETNYPDTLYVPANLAYNSTYFWKIVAYNSAGDSVVGPVWSFSTEMLPVTCPGIPTVADIDGNVYNTVQIGNQCWMKENLKTTTYRNGLPIPNVTGTSDWADLTTGAFVWYENDTAWKQPYGGLYNWFAVHDTSGLCPEGWHVAGHDDWSILTDFIGGIEEPHANELKSCRQVNSPLGGDCNTVEHPRWSESGNNQYGTDDYGFSCFPGGYRGFNGSFQGLGDYGIWWTSHEASGNYAWERLFRYYTGYISVNSDLKASGYSVRCIKDLAE